VDTTWLMTHRRILLELAKQLAAAPYLAKLHIEGLGRSARFFQRRGAKLLSRIGAQQGQALPLGTPPPLRQDRVVRTRLPEATLSVYDWNRLEEAANERGVFDEPAP